MFKYKNHLSFYELINLINYAIDLRTSIFTPASERFYVSTLNNYDNIIPILSNISLERDQDFRTLLSIYRNNFLRIKNNTLDTKIETLKDFLNVDNNIIKVPAYSNDKLVLYDKYNYDKFLYYNFIPLNEVEIGIMYPVHYTTYMNNHIDNFETMCEIGNLNYDYIILLNNLLYKMILDYKTNELENLETNTNQPNFFNNQTIPDILKVNLKNYVFGNETFIRNIKNVNLPIDFINEATQIIIQNSKKLDIMLNDIIAYLTSTSELFNVYIEEKQTITETITQDEDVTATKTHTKQAKVLTKQISDEDISMVNDNNKSVDYIINNDTDIDNIDGLYSNKYSDKATQNRSTITSSKNKNYTETLNDDGDNIENQDVTARDSETTKQHTNTFNRYKGIDIDIKTYREIINEVINIPNKMYDFLRLGVS